MENKNKVLTVSYGTFSCTLEGFEDSFGTMQAIAEYFRDMSARDRYFGAEPAQPDPEMLAHIARQEITNQANIKSGNNHIDMRADSFPSTATALTADPVEPLVPENAPNFANSRPDADGEPSAVLIHEVAQDSFEVETPAPATQTKKNDAGLTNAPANAGDSTAPVAPPETKPAPASDSIAAKLQRIRDVVSQNEDDAKDAGFSEDQHAEMFAPSPLTDITGSTLTLITPTLATTNQDTVISAVQKPETASEADETPDPVNAEQDQKKLKDRNDPYIFDETIADLELAGEGDDTPTLNTSFLDNNGVPQSGETSQKSPILSDNDLNGDSLAPATADSEVIVGLDDLPIKGTELNDVLNIMGSNTEQNPVRVAKIKRANLDATIATGDLEDITDGHHDEPVTEDEAPGGMSGQITRLPVTADGEGDLSRLLAAADEKLDDPETSTSRDTYFQLRAAVAAAEADKSTNVSAKVSPVIDGAYRADLADVVHPANSETAKARPQLRSQPAPLKLVAEQRIDLVDSDRKASRPRRVPLLLTDKISKDRMVDFEGGFVEFAREKGAIELPDLLEAAASYLSFVEGMSQFSRPQLMNKVRLVEIKDFNREDGLRFFGRLLREGKIEKAGGGRFTASGDIGFRPGERAAG